MKGVYFMANDAVLDWAIAFLESVRSHPAHSDLPLTLIPYDDRLAGMRRLAERYRFEILEDDSLRMLDALGARIGSRPRSKMPHLRKLASFWGPFESFLFLDSDIVVVDDLRSLLDTAAGADEDLLYFDHAVAQVYAGPACAGLPFDPSRSAGYNTGAFASRRGLFDLQSITELVAAAEPHRAAFVDVGEQPFLNFVFDATARTAAPYTRHDPSIASAMWAGLPLTLHDGGCRVDDPARSDHGHRLPFVHWAGYTLTPWMPHKSLWKRYRLGDGATVAAHAALEGRLLATAARRGVTVAGRRARSFTARP